MAALVGYFAVPLNAMCSAKWLHPASDAFSRRLPIGMEKQTEQLFTPAISDVATHAPFSSFVIFTFSNISSFLSDFQIKFQRPN